MVNDNLTKPAADVSDIKAPTKWEKITRLIMRYHAKMHGVSNCLAAESPDLAIKKDYEKLNFHVDKDALKRIDKIRELPGFDRLLVFFGTEKELHDTNTIIILGGDTQGNVLPQHKKDDPPGEETWPDDGYKLRVGREDLEDDLK